MYIEIYPKDKRIERYKLRFVKRMYHFILIAYRILNKDKMIHYALYAVYIFQSFG